VFRSDDNVQVGFVALNVLQSCHLVASAEFLNMGLFSVVFVTVCVLGSENV